MSLAIEAKNLTRNFKGSPPVRALDGVHLQVRENEIFVLLGRNGAGKTTLIKTLCTLLAPDAGEARIFGLDLARNGPDIRRLISLAVGEERGFYWRLTGRQNLLFFAALYNLPRKMAGKKIDELAAAFELEFLDKRYDLCSTGMKHRLALARCFLTGAKLIFMDEPTRSLDPAAKSGLRSLLKTIAKKMGCTFFLTTHDTREAEDLADQMAILDQGRIISCGTLLEIQRDAQKPDASLEQVFCTLTGPESNHVY